MRVNKTERGMGAKRLERKIESFVKTPFVYMRKVERYFRFVKSFYKILARGL